MKKSNAKNLVWLGLAAVLAACDSGGGSGSSPGAPGTNGGSSTGGTGVACSINQATANSTPAVMSAHLSTAQVSHIPASVRNMADQGKLAEEQTLPVTVALNLNNQADLEGKLAELYQPGNPNFHKFMTPDQFKARYAPTSDQINEVKSYLQAQGLQVVSVNENGNLIQAKGTAAALGTAFQTEIHQYRDQKGTQYFAPSAEPILPADLPIQAVHGLQNVTKWKSYAKPRAASNPGQASAPAHSGTGSDGGFAPADIRTAYQTPTSVTGAGQTLGLMELDGYNASDITAYEKAFGIPNVPLSNVLIDGSTGSAGGGEGEVTLDIELMTALAPGASGIIVYEGENSSSGILDVYSKIASDNKAQEISSSWGTSEYGNTSAFAQSENTVFEQMAAQGQSIFAAAGDDGADDNGSSLSVDDPAAQPYVVGVGGTTLTTGTGQAYTSETTWNDPSGSVSAGGGGVSAVWPIPSWQAGLATSANLGSSTMRNVPDVSLNADPNTGYAIYEAGGWGVWGGTSCAAPLWAAYTALVNQQRVANGMGELGFPNPALYAVGKSGSYGSDFHDIADGSTNGHYPAETGYDNATGWGSFIGQGLFNSLTAGSASGC
jgi:subtilase family serine protease